MLTIKSSVKKLAAMAAAVVLVACSAPTATGPVGSPDYSGFGPFEPLLGVGIAVEGTVGELIGPRAELNEFGGVNYVGRSENAEDWTTPLGMPMLRLDDVTIVATATGSERADAVRSRVQAELKEAGALTMVAPVGTYEVGERLEFWLKDWQGETQMSYLVFDLEGVTLPGLDLPGADEGVRDLVDISGLVRRDALSAFATEMNLAESGQPQGALMDHFYGPDESQPGNAVPDGYYPTFEGEVPVEDEFIPISVYISGGNPGSAYGLEGRKLLGWSVANGDGLAHVVGFMPPGETVTVVVQDLETQVVEFVEGSPRFEVQKVESEVQAVLDLESGRVIEAPTLAELDDFLRPPGVVSEVDLDK